jgi:hypothetical protein
MHRMTLIAVPPILALAHCRGRLAKRRHASGRISDVCGSTSARYLDRYSLTHLKLSGLRGSLCLKPLRLSFPFRPSSCAFAIAPPIHSIKLLAKTSISSAVRLTRHSGYAHRCRVSASLEIEYDQCWSSKTRSSRSRGDASTGNKSDLLDVKVDVMRSEVWQKS